MKIDAVKLFTLCADRGLSLTQVRKQTGISLSTLQAIRRGDKVRLATLGRLACLLNVKSIELLEVT